MSKFNNFVNQLKLKMVDHSPEIYLGVGLTLMTSSVVLGIATTPKVMKIIKVKEKEEGYSLSTKEVIQTSWKHYLPTAATLVAGGVCIVNGCKIQNKRYAAVAAAYKISETAFSELETKVIEEIGEKKVKDIKDEIAKDRVENNPVDARRVYDTGTGHSLCYDINTNQYFEADIDVIKRAVNDFNEELLDEMFMSLNDFYYLVGLPPMEPIGDLLGWDIMSGKLEMEYSSQLVSEYGPCLTIDYRRNIKPL